MNAERSSADPARSSERGRVAPAGRHRAGQRIDEQHQPGGDRRGAGDVEVAMPQLGAALIQEPRRNENHGRADGDVDEEHPRPGEIRGEHAAEQHARCAAGAGGGAPDAERAVPLATLPERRHQDRERRGGEQGAAETLQGAKRDQRALGPGESAQEGARREEGETGDEQAPAAEDVGEAAAEEQEAAEDDRVCADHPLQARFGKVEVGLDRRQRDVHDGDIEDDHELRDDDDREGEPAAAALGKCIDRGTNHL